MQVHLVLALQFAEVGGEIGLQENKQVLFWALAQYFSRLGSFMSQVLKGVPVLLSLDEPTPALQHFLSACGDP